MLTTSMTNPTPRDLLARNIVFLLKEPSHQHYFRYHSTSEAKTASQALKEPVLLQLLAGPALVDEKEDENIFLVLMEECAEVQQAVSKVMRSGKKLSSR